MPKGQYSNYMEQQSIYNSLDTETEKRSNFEELKL